MTTPSFEAVLVPEITFGIPLSTTDPAGSLEAELNLALVGATGPGVPDGGTTGQILAKTSDADQATGWVDPDTGAGTVTSVNAVLPDIAGNVELTPGDIGAQPAGDYLVNTATGAYSVSAGAGSNASGDRSAALGGFAIAAGADSVAIGDGADATADNSIAIGAQSEAAERSMAVGFASTATALEATALGAYSLATGTYSTALGRGATATAAYSTALGYGATSAYTNSVALGNGSNNTRENEVSVGTGDASRLVANVAAGLLPSDATNLGQVEGLISAAPFGSVNSVNGVAPDLAGDVSLVPGDIGAEVAGAAAAAVVAHVAQADPHTQYLLDSQATAAGLAVLGAASATAQTALFDTFTAAAKGLVPAPVTSSLRFLRDDGTWQTVAASPGGSSGQVQYNNAGAFGGIPGTTFSGNTLAVVSQAAAAIPFAVQAATSQTGNLSEWRNSVGALWARLTPNSTNGFQMWFSGHAAGGTGRGFTLSANNGTGQAVFTTDISAGFNLDSILVGATAGSTGMNLNNTGINAGRDLGTSFTLTHGTYFSDVAARSVTLNAATAYATAATNIVGGAFAINGGAGAASAGGAAAGGAVNITGGVGYGTGNGGAIVIQGGAASGSGVRGRVRMPTLPTSSAGLVAGDVWSNAGVLTVV